MAPAPRTKQQNRALQSLSAADSNTGPPLLLAICNCMKWAGNEADTTRAAGILSRPGTLSQPPRWRGLEPSWHLVTAAMPRKGLERKAKLAKLAKLERLSHGRWKVAGLEELAAATTQGEPSDAAPAVEEDPVETWGKYRVEHKCTYHAERSTRLKRRDDNFVSLLETIYAIDEDGEGPLFASTVDAHIPTPVLEDGSDKLLLAVRWFRLSSEPRVPRAVLCRALRAVLVIQNKCARL